MRLVFRSRRDVAAMVLIDGLREVASTSVGDVPHVHTKVAMPPERRNLRRRLIVGDAAASLIAWGAAIWLADRPDRNVAVDLALVGLAVAFTLLALHWQQLYRARVACNRSDEIARIGRAACAVVAAGLAADHLFEGPVPTLAVVAGGGATFVAVSYQRGRFRQWVRSERAAGRFGRPVLVVGGSSEAGALTSMLNDCPELGFVPVAFAGRLEPDAGDPSVPWVGGTGSITEKVGCSGASGVVIAATAVPSIELNRMVRELHRERIHVHISSGITGMHHRRLRVQPIGYEPLIYVEPCSLSSVEASAKRALDLCVAGLGLLVALPVLAVAAAAVKLSDGGPVLFRQERVGRGGAPFLMLKLRTMCADAEERLETLQDDNERDGPLFKLSDDPRVTRVGRFLRATSIDELPQLVNVLGGSMSMVGPRPALASEVDQFTHAAARHAVRPGITGLWQVEARDKASFAAYERLDLFYVENWSVWLDMAIIVRTASVVVSHARRASAMSHHHPVTSLQPQVEAG